ncbi:hypothetical protein D3C77_385890 [compost metagenome]
MRGVDQAMGNEKSEVLEAFVYFRCRAGKQQHYTGKKDQYSEHWGGKSGCHLDCLAGDFVSTRLTEQQHGAGKQQRQYHIDQAI